jgi:four helix bundle protein
MPIRNYRDLLAWQTAMNLAEEVYKVTKRFPADERFVLSPQLRRAAVSIPSNIAEGHGVHSDPVLRRHLAIAHGSLCELETQVLLAARLGYLDESDLRTLLSAASEVARLMTGLSHAASLS